MTGQAMGERCGWAGAEPIYLEYHDTEWGVPERDSRALWEKLVLDGFQAGLSWITILKKRDSFRTAFAGFDPEVIAGWGEAEVLRCLADPGIIRHRGKIEATIGNAQAYLRIEEKQGFSEFLWDYVGGEPIQNRWASLGEVPAFTPLSTRISKDLKVGRVPVLRTDHRLCVSAGDGTGERPPDKLPPARPLQRSGPEGGLKPTLRKVGLDPPYQRDSASSSASRAATQVAPSADSSFFQNGARDLR
jgi:DNA-3-methyladenine glycosylase I